MQRHESKSHSAYLFPEATLLQGVPKTQE